MFVAGAVCPHPPLLFPEVAQRSEPALDDLRAACSTAVAQLVGVGVDVVVCVGAGQWPAGFDESAGGSMRGFGVDARAGATGSDVLPLAHTVGARLLDAAGWQGARRYVVLPAETTAQEAVGTGRSVAGADLRVGVLALGDGSARRSREAPGYLDERAEPFDAEVARALAAPDPRRLADGLPPLACAELWVQGRPAWQFLAGAAECLPADGAALTATLHYDAAPFGVGYFVATWVAGEAPGQPR